MKKSVLFFLFFLFISSTYAQQAITVSTIRFEGLHRIPVDTALNYLPLKSGEELTPALTRKTIKMLYETGFFETVSLEQEGRTLIIQVKERPTIASIIASGNNDLSKEQLDSVLKNLSLIDGLTFNQATLDKFVASLDAEYERRGKYNVKITPTVTPTSRNRVDIHILISEGRTAVIKQINFSGNATFSNFKLSNQLPIATGPFSFIKHRNLFSQEKLGDTSKALSNFYLDQGYIQFKIETAQVTVTPDRKFVYINFKLQEGPVYTLKDTQWAGKTILSENELKKLSTVKINKPFSRKTVQETVDAISKALGEKGYAYAIVNPIPKIDEKNKTVLMTFYIEPGQRIYVRRITFSGNIKTADIVLRHAMKQPEGGIISLSKVEQSTRALNLLGYLEEVHLETTPVPDTTDEVDLNYHIKEGPTAQALFSAGYGSNGLTFSAQVNQNDFLGTGKFLGVNATTNLMGQVYNISYNNPYYTVDGIQRGFNLYYNRNTPGRLNTVNYTTDLFGGMVSYVIPISEKDDALNVGFGYQNTLLSQGGLPATQVVEFIQDNGHLFNQLLFNLGWSRNGYDRASFPTRGLNQSFNSEMSGPIMGKPLDYIKLTYHAHYYHPLHASSPFIISLLGNLGYGFGYGSTSQLPFFKNYYAGGIGYMGAVRGYNTNSLGPRDSTDKPLGGNALMTGTTAFIFPNPVKNMRSSLFIDGGNVYNTHTNSIQLSQLRFSTGLAVDWQVPLLNFLLNLSAALPVNARPIDETQYFQFALATNFD